MDNLPTGYLARGVERPHRRIEVHLANQQDRRECVAEADNDAGQSNGSRSSFKQRPEMMAVGAQLQPASQAIKYAGWWQQVVVIALTATVVGIALFGLRFSTTTGKPSAPSDGYYGAVAQYQIAHLQLKQELRGIAAGDPVNAELMRLRTAVLASKASILTEPSEVRTALSDVPGFEDATRQIAELQRRIGPVLERPGFGQRDAQQVLDELKAQMDDEALSGLASSMRLAEATAQDSLLASLNRRMTLAVIGFGLCWAVLSLWLLHVARSRRRFAAADVERTQAVQAMEQAIGAKRKFLSMVSHELRSPLQSIVTGVESIAQEVCTHGNHPQSVAAIRRIRHAVSVMQGQFRDLLTIARSDTSPLGLQVETFDFSELVRDVCADFEDAALAKGLAFSVGVPAATLTVRADPVRVAQVLRNLVENAVRYTHAGRVEVHLLPTETTERLSSQESAAVGKIALKPGQAPSSPKALRIRFTVLDTGPGLPPEALQRLEAGAVPFEPHIDGTGIGIFVIRDVLQQLDGSIEVQTRNASDPEGLGTTFTLSIPATRVQDAAAPGERGGCHVSLSVLVVDDLADVRESLRDVTQRLGHLCNAAASATEARPLLANAYFDAVLIDLEMPDTDGLALATEIRKKGGRNAASMLILISAAENRATGQVWPFDGFLQKPIDSHDLARLIGARAQLP